MKTSAPMLAMPTHLMSRAALKVQVRPECGTHTGTVAHHRQQPPVRRGGHAVQRHLEPSDEVRLQLLAIRSPDHGRLPGERAESSRFEAGGNLSIVW